MIDQDTRVQKKSRTHLCRVVRAGLLALVASNATAQSLGLTPMDLFRLEYALDPQISADGQWIAYVRRWPDVLTDRFYSSIWLVKVDGSEHRPLTSGKFFHVSPRWSPDGRRLAYVSNRSGRPQIHVHRMDSATDTVITSGEPPSAITWSPDGASIAFLRLVAKPELVVGNLLRAPAGATWAPAPKYTNALVYRFDGVGEIPPGHTHLFVVPADGGTARQLTSGDIHYTSSLFVEPRLGWTPDGAEIVLAARRAQDPDRHPFDSDLYSVAVKDGVIRRLTDRVGPDDTPAVSPDGRLIAFTGFDDRKQSFHTTRLYVMHRDGTGKRALSARLDRGVGVPHWAADGRGLYVTFDDNGNTKVAVIDLEGNVRVIADDVGTGGTAYGGGSFSIARNGTVAFTRTTPTVPSQITVRSDRSTRDVTALNDSLLANRTLARADEIQYRSSKDGREIHGWILRPPGFDSTKRYPIVLEIHGGPFANYGARFDVEKQVLAAHGYVVFYANPRGSTSYGEEFFALAHQAFPGDEYFDLLPGVDAVIAKGFVDERNQFVTGGSGGGGLTAWLTGHTDRFRAAVALYPITNWESAVLGGDLPGIEDRFFPGPPWDHREHYFSRSLLSVVKRVKTPTLVMTGDQDLRTPLMESEQYYRALKLLGVESVLVRVPEGSHGLWSRPSQSAAKLSTMIGWFEKHRVR